MILRYYDTDYRTYVENELLFVGSPMQCYLYLFKNWSVDVSELKHDPELCSTFHYYLRHIQVADDDYGKRTVEEVLEKYPAWSNTRWYYINDVKLVFNKELVEMHEQIEENYLDALGGDWKG